MHEDVLFGNPSNIYKGIFFSTSSSSLTAPHSASVESKYIFTPTVFQLAPDYDSLYEPAVTFPLASLRVSGVVPPQAPFFKSPKRKQAKKNLIFLDIFNAGFVCPLTPLLRFLSVDFDLFMSF
jgi:hypothetical protein